MRKDYVDNPFQSPAVISFCPGILGIERGLERVGIKCRVAAYVEIESIIIANLVAGMEAGVLAPAPIWTDAKTFDASPFRGKIHGFVGGYPCPGESLAGLREGHLYKGFIWPSIRRAIAAVRPLWCFFENVDDHLTGTYPIVQRSLRNLGYSVEAGIFTAEEAGAPHERGRLFILAIELGYAQSINKWYDRNEFGKSKFEDRRSGPEMGNAHRSGTVQIGEHNPKMPGIQETGGPQIGTYVSGQSGTEMEHTRGIGHEPQHAVSAGRNGTELAGKELADPKIIARGLPIQSGGSQQSGAEFIGSSKTVADPDSSRSGTRNEPTGREKGANPGRGGKKSKVGNATGIGERKPADQTDPIATEGGARDESINTGELSNAVRQGLEKRGEQPTREELPTVERSGDAGIQEMANPDIRGTQSREHAGVGRVRELDAWPAGPGEFQHAWEAPRTLHGPIRLPPTLRNLWNKSGKSFKKMLGKEVWKEIDDNRKIKSGQSEVEPGLDFTIAGYNFREDILRAAGNSVVEQCAELAFIELMGKHFKKGK